MIDQPKLEANGPEPIAAQVPCDQCKNFPQLCEGRDFSGQVCFDVMPIEASDSSKETTG